MGLRGLAAGLLTLILAISFTGYALAGPTADEQQLRLDPELYATARQYFPSDDAGMPSKRIFRLTRDQLDATAKALLSKYVTSSVKKMVARDPLQTNYEFAEILNFNAANIGGLSEWIAKIASRVKQDPSGVIDCVASSNSQTCLTSAVRSFIMKAFRGDATDETIGRIIAFYTAGVKSVGFEQATAELVEVVLNSPHFLFRKELDVNRNNRLTPAQLLQAVTYTIADASPEKLGLESENAERYLRSGAEAGPAIVAMLSSNDAREKLVRFFKAWLEVKEPGEFTISQQTFPEFTPKLAAAMLDETDRFLRHALAKPVPRLSDITQSTHTFASKALEAIYQTQAASADGAKPIKLDAAQRLGIFSHPAVLASHSGPTNTRPIKRGVFWVRKVMCMDLDPPPNDVHTTGYAGAATTERRRIEDLTQTAACVGCHNVINPFGFFQENYDALGRWRKLDNGHPVDTSISIDFLDEDPVKTTGPVEALKTFTGSAMFKQCFVRQLFRFYMGRMEEASDHPLLRRMFFEFAHEDRQSITDMVYMLAASDRIVRRQ